METYIDEIIYADGGMLEQSFNYNENDVEKFILLQNIIVTSDNQTIADQAFRDKIEGVIMDFERLKFAVPIRIYHCHLWVITNIVWLPKYGTTQSGVKSGYPNTMPSPTPIHLYKTS